MNQKNATVLNTNTTYRNPVMRVDHANTREQQRSTHLSEDELLLQSINKNINEGIYRSVKNGLVYVNEAFTQMFGYDDEFEILRLDSSHLYANKEVCRNLAKEIINKGSVTNREVEFIKKDGSTFIGSFSSTKVTGGDGVTYFDGAIRDITFEKKAEEKSQHQASIQEALIRISSKYINNSLENIEETVNSTLKELGLFLNVDRVQIHDYDFNNQECSCTYEWCREGVKSTIEQSRSVPLSAIESMMQLHSKGETMFVEDINLMPDGLAKSVLLSYDIKSVISVPMMLENSCVGFVSLDSTNFHRSYDDNEVTMLKLFANMSVNITARAFDQKRLHDLLETTVVQNKRLRDFSHITSHNIRTSVANLIAIDDLLQDDPANNQLLRSLNITVQKLNQSIYNINTLLNFDAKNEFLETKNCNLSSILKKSLRELDGSISSYGVEVVNDLPKRLLVNGLPVYVENIFKNILTNAVKFGTNENAKKILISAEKTQDAITISITDHGQGIDLNRYGAKLFKAGVRFQLNNCTGQGMGLFMSKYMLEAMGGEITVESKVGKGATFLLKFPRP